MNTVMAPITPLNRKQKHRHRHRCTTNVHVVQPFMLHCSASCYSFSQQFQAILVTRYVSRCPSQITVAKARRPCRTLLLSHGFLPCLHFSNSSIARTIVASSVFGNCMFCFSCSLEHHKRNRSLLRVVVQQSTAQLLFPGTQVFVCCVCTVLRRCYLKFPQTNSSSFTARRLERHGNGQPVGHITHILVTPVTRAKRSKNSRPRPVRLSLRPTPYNSNQSLYQYATCCRNFHRPTSYSIMPY